MSYIEGDSPCKRSSRGKKDCFAIAGDGRRKRRCEKKLENMLKS